LGDTLYRLNIAAWIASFRSTTQRSHVRLCPSFVNENKLFYVKCLLHLLPLFAFFGNIFAMLFGGLESLFSM